MGLMAWLVVLFSLYTIGQFYAILRLGDLFEMDPDAGQLRPNIWHETRDSDNDTRGSQSPSAPDSRRCPACGAPNETGYAFCRQCARPVLNSYQRDSIH